MTGGRCLIAKRKKVGKALTQTRKSLSRKYDNTSRAASSAQTQKDILEALIALLAERKGGEVKIEEVAERTGITARTIFRFFKDRKTLHEAMDKYLISYLQAGAAQMEALDFVGFGKNAYRLFDSHEALTTAYVLSPLGHEARAIFRKKLSMMMIARIQSERGPITGAEATKRLALITSLVNAKIWYDIKSDFGYSGADMQSAVDWALNTLLKNLETP